jgi:hypothetical protein
MEERRKHKRYSIAYPVEGVAVNENFDDSLLDLSREGISFIGNGDIAKGTAISIRLFLKKRMFNLAARVIHVKRLKTGNFIIGARFINSPGEFKSLFAEEIEDIKQMHRGLTLREHKETSFKGVSRRYLKTQDVS